MGDVIIAAIKIVLTAALLPFVIAAVTAFQSHLSVYSNSFKDFLIYGFYAYFILFLFVYKFSSVYEFGQRVIAAALGFLSPVNKPVSYLVPFYFPLILLACFLVSQFLDVKGVEHYFLFFAGFTFAMHILHSAQDLQEQEKSFLKPTYWFLMCLVVLSSLVIGVLMFDVVTQEFTFNKFVQSVFSASEDNYSSLFDRFF